MKGLTLLSVKKAFATQGMHGVTNGEEIKQDQAAASGAEGLTQMGGSWQEQDDILRRLWTEKKPPEEIAEILGRSVAAIMTRAARLSLPRRTAPGRKRGYKRTDPPSPRTLARTAPKIKVHVPVPVDHDVDHAPPPEIKTRVCLMCLNKFQSLGAFNRICPTCKGSAEYATGSSTPDFAFKVTT